MRLAQILPPLWQPRSRHHRKTAKPRIHSP
jgi:hypothetical protein